MSRAFNAAYNRRGRPSDPPEHLPKALLRQAFYSIRSERQLVGHLDVNLLFLFRWFLELPANHPAWVAMIFTKNREGFEWNGLIHRFLAVGV